MIMEKKLRKVYRYRDLVSDTVDVDNFKLRDLGRIAANTFLAPIKTVANVVTLGKSDKVRSWGYNNPSDFSNKKVGKVATGIFKGQQIATGAALALAGGVGASKGIAALGAKKAALSGGTLTAKKPSVTSSHDIPLKGLSKVTDAVQTTPTSSGIGVQPSGSNVIEKVKMLASKITPEQLQKGKQILQRGTGVLSNAQREFQELATDPSRLPKTKALKDAESKLMLPQNESVKMATIPSPNITLLVIGIGVIIVGYFLFVKK